MSVQFKSSQLDGKMDEFTRDMWSSINMQVVHASFPGRTFVVPRCSDSREKKTRNRRTKEERKTMVVSFVKKYQSSNGGKFPSLNLTHKEVGGSFYTVREIVREIIQENRVLGPGSLTSKSLSLEYFPEDETEESFSVDISPLSITTIKHTIDLHEEKHLFSNEYSRISPRITQLSESHPSGNFEPQVLHGEQFNDTFSNGNLNGKLGSSGYEEPNFGKQVEVADDKVEVPEQKNGQFQAGSSDKPGIDKIEHLLCQDESITPSLSEVVVNSDDTIERSHEVVMAFNSSEVADEKVEIPEQKDGEFQASGSDETGLDMIEHLSCQDVSITPSLSEIVVNSEDSRERSNVEVVTFSSSEGINYFDEPNILESGISLASLPDDSQEHSDFTASVEAHTPFRAQISRSEEPELHKVEKAAPLCQAVSITPPLGEVVVNGDNSGNKSYEITSEFSSPEGCNSSMGSDVSGSVSYKSLNTIPSYVSDQVQHPSHFKDYSPAATKTYDQDKSLEKQNVSTSKVQNRYDSAEVRDTTLPFETDSIMISSETLVNKTSAESDSEPLSQNLESPACVSVLRPSLQSNDLENVSTKTKSTSEEVIQPNLNGRIFSDVKAEEYESTVVDTGSAKTSGSISENEANVEAEAPDVNPFLAAIKYFLNAVVKFWTE